MSRSGRYVALASGDELELVDALGTGPRQRFPRGADADFYCARSAVWILGGALIRRWAIETGKELPPLALPFAGVRLRAVPGDGAALVIGATQVAFAPGELLDGLPVTTWPLDARRVLRADADGLRVIELGRGEVGRLKPVDGAPIAAWPLFGGRAIAILVRGAAGDQFLVCRLDGASIHAIALPRAGSVGVAEQRGTAVIAGPDATLTTIDLRYGRTLAETAAPVDVAELELDADGRYVAIATAVPGAAPRVIHLAMTELLAGGRPRPAREAAAESIAARHEVTPASDDEPLDASSGDVEVAAEAAAPAPVTIPDRVPLAFGRPNVALTATPVDGAPPYGSALEHFDDLLELVAALTGRAITLGWHSGRLSATANDPRPFYSEVHALLGGSGDFAGDEVNAAERRVAELSQRLTTRARSTLAAGVRLPLVELARELELSAIAIQVLAVAIGAAVRGEIARLYGILSNDEHRPLCDAQLITQIVAAGHPRLRADVQRELADDAPLVRYGLLRVSAERNRLFAAITVDEVLVERLCGDPPSAGLGDVTSLRHGDRTLAQLRIPAAVLREIVLACAEPRPAATPLRLVLRGRRGSGRTTLVAALAARLGRPVSATDCARMPRNGRRIAAALRAELSRALLRSTVPVVSGLDLLDAEDVEGRDLIHQALRGHPGPVIVRASPEAAVPFEPGHLSFTLPATSESERASVWQDVLAEVGLPCRDPDTLAARYRIGPGTITTVVRAVAARRAQDGVAADVDAGAWLDDAARQHITTRLDRVASHVTRLAAWEQVALPEDCLDSLREFIGRVRHRRTVYETWGYDRKMSTSRGLTALFYGPPGTGKSMVAGLIARELGLELYRVDLARVVSKWIGETEKNLAEVFDAAEDGQVVVLFDEADSMFAKRSADVKSAVDRYANLEVNYLLQRLDSFEGIAILTTNLEGAIDPAFKRRMSLRLQFPFPDEEIRARLWAAHVPSEVPVTGDLDFVDLAHRFPLSGGYIRNSAIRAAFLAAQEGRPLSHEHMTRAIQLEYRELGKLSSGGRME